MTGFGELVALTTAFLWTISSFLWGRVKLNAFELNICKNIIACLLLVIHMGGLLLIGYVGSAKQQDSDASANPKTSLVAESETNQEPEIKADSNSGFRLKASPVAWLWLGLSGVIGIVVGDTCFFRSLQILGPRRSLVVATSSPLFAVILGWLMLNEHLALLKIIGVLLTVAGISIVVSEKKGQAEALDLYPGRQSVGIGFGLCAAGCQVIGLAFSKIGMKLDDCSPLEATFIRILFAAICALSVQVIRRKVIDFFKRALKVEVLKAVFFAAAIGSWLGIWLSQVAIQRTDIGIAQTLFSTCPLFAIPLVFLIQGHETSAIALGGTIVAIGGVAMIVL